MTLPLPPQMLTAVQIIPGVYYPLYRLVIIVAALAVAAFLYALVMRTRLGMLIRAGASNREMVGALGVNIKLLYTLVFGLGAALAGFAGVMQAPILTVQIGMGENILILAFVVIIIGGIGSIRGAFVAAVIVGLIDTLGRAFLPDMLRAHAQHQRRADAGAGAVVDVDLHADGGDPGVSAGRTVPGGEPMNAPLDPPCSKRRRARGSRRDGLTALLLAVLALVPIYAVLTGDTFAMTLFTRILILALGAREPQPDHGLWRHGELRPRRLSRHRRLRGRHPGEGRHRVRLRAVAGGDRGLGALSRSWSARSACARAASISS